MAASKLPAPKAPKPDLASRYWGADWTPSVGPDGTYQETDSMWLETLARREHDRQVENLNG